MAANEIVVREFNGVEIPQRRSDRYLNATAACKANGKEWSNYWQNQTTQEFVTALVDSLGIPRESLIESRGGRTGGTWVHPRLAIHLAMWCSPEFAVQVTEWIEQLLTTGHVGIDPAAERDLALRTLELCKSVLSIGGMEERDAILLKDYARNSVLSGTGEQTQFVTLSTRVEQLGFGRPPNWFLSRLGREIKRAYRAKRGKDPTTHSQFVDGAAREVCTYTTDDLPLIDPLIREFFKRVG
jgi:hypothetical protein